MSDRVLLITWGENIAGREAHALEVFNEAIGMYGRFQQEGRIERFEVALLAPEGDFDGYNAVYGTLEQITEMRESDEFQHNMIAATLVVKHLRMADGYVGEAVAKQAAMYQEEVEKVPQMA
jgi:hypothetical protein